ncbi:flagellar hook-length control protein FliK [Pseudalkalibacillus decolorationis]|uniref:flagellar hook-length control protein FliK n=1 Tax=Pseudalkalibacillus decolorationis TaxID=163879 RepID=UPI0021489CA8|nr:flagellar hook-length control protein FliK [Pseudalkalibacillus decolorationis]
MNNIATMSVHSVPVSKTNGLQKTQSIQGFQSLITEVLTADDTVGETELVIDEERMEWLPQFLQEFNELTEADLSFEELVKQLQHLLTENNSVKLLPETIQIQPVKVQHVQSVYQPKLEHSRMVMKEQPAQIVFEQNNLNSGQKEQLLQDFLRFLMKEGKGKGMPQITTLELKGMLKEAEPSVNQAEPSIDGKGNRLTGMVHNRFLFTITKTISEQSITNNGQNLHSVILPKPESKIVGNMVIPTNTTIMGKVQQYILHVPQEQVSTSSFVQELTKIINRGRMLTLPNGQTQLSIKLFPEQLGTLDVQIFQRNGEIAAKIIASTAQAKDLIESNLHQLRHSLGGQNIAVDKIEVTHHTPEWVNDKQNREERNQPDSQHQEQGRESTKDKPKDESFEQWLKEMELEEV